MRYEHDIGTWSILKSVLRFYVFTMVELLVVIAIIAILASLLLPALGKAKACGKKAGCIGGLRQISGGVGMYAADYAEWLPHGGESLHSGSATISWKELLLPYFSKTVAKRDCETGVFKCPGQTIPKCVDTAMGDNGAYGGYGWNFQTLGWWNVWRSDCGGVDPWIKITQVYKPSQTIEAGDTSDYYVNDTALCYQVFYLYGRYSPGALRESYRHEGGGIYLWVDGHCSFHLATEAAANAAWFKNER